MANWTFLTHHARVLLCVAHDGRERTIGEILALLAGPVRPRPEPGEPLVHLGR
jgi:hypothetical protein